jgi:hypothetical protein
MKWESRICHAMHGRRPAIAERKVSNDMIEMDFPFAPTAFEGMWHLRLTFSRLENTGQCRGSCAAVLTVESVRDQGSDSLRSARLGGCSSHLLVMSG